MRGRRLFTLSVSLGVAALFLGCSHSAPPQSALGTSKVSLTIHDSPPAGVAVLSFAITVTGATLNPTDQGIGSSRQSVSVLNAPVDVELTQLVTDRAFLGVAAATEGTYQSLTLTFANARLTIQNNSGSAIGSCANGATCELTPAVTPASVIVPFVQGQNSTSLTLTTGGSAGLDIDFDLGQSIQNDLSILPTLTVAQLPVGPGSQGQQVFAEIDNLQGVVSYMDFVSKFNLTMNNGQTLTLFVNDTDTQAFGFTPDSHGLQVGETVRANARLLVDGTLVATQVYLEQTVEQAQQRNEIVGTVSSVDSPTQFHMVMHDIFPPANGIQVGNVVTVTIQGGAAFDVASDGLTVPSGLSFASSSDLMIGQEVQVSIASSPAVMEVTTDQITLRKSQIAGTVTANGFTLGNLPALFTNSGITAIQGAVVPETTPVNPNIFLFKTVGVRGLLFNTTGSPTLVADTVSQRPNQ